MNNAVKRSTNLKVFKSPVENPGKFQNFAQLVLKKRTWPGNGRCLAALHKRKCDNYCYFLSFLPASS